MVYLRDVLYPILSNRSRSLITLVIISVGICSLVGSVTSIHLLRHRYSQAMEQMGVSLFRLSDLPSSDVPLTLDQLLRFQVSFPYSALFSIYDDQHQIQQLQCGSTTLNSLPFLAADDHYLPLHFPHLPGFPLYAGQCCLLGPQLASRLGITPDEPQTILFLNSIPFRVLAVLPSPLPDPYQNALILPLSTAKHLLFLTSPHYSLDLKLLEPVPASLSLSAAESTLRAIRRLSPIQKTDFSLTRCDELSGQSSTISLWISRTAIAVGLISLLGAAVSLTNITLVSVRERTLEIGLKKAIGASCCSILCHFLLEAALLGQAGCVIGIVLGLGMAALVSWSMKSPFYLPWAWMCLSSLLCLVVSLSASYFPARKASKLDPVESLKCQ